MSEQEKYSPKYLYHKTLGGQLIQSQEQEDALGEGWEDSPTKHGFEKYPAPKPTAKFIDFHGNEIVREISEDEAPKKPKKTSKGE